MTRSDDERRACKKYSLTVGVGLIDLPPEFDINPLPNLGPKVNHHFKLNNAMYLPMEHPRWGFIQSVTTTRDIHAGEEIFTNYGYKKKGPFPSDFPWYWKAQKVLDKQDLLAKQAKKNVKKWKCQQELKTSGNSSTLKQCNTT